MRDVSQIKRTAPHDRLVEWKTPAKECCVGQSASGARRIFKKTALGGQLSEGASDLVSAVVLAGLDRESSTREGGGEDGKRWDGGENTHGVCAGRKECGVVESTRRKEGRRSEEDRWEEEGHRSVQVLYSTGTRPSSELPPSLNPSSELEAGFRPTPSLSGTRRLFCDIPIVRGQLMPSPKTQRTFARRNPSARAAQKHQFLFFSSPFSARRNPGQPLLLSARSEQVDLPLTPLTTFPSHPPRFPRPPLPPVCSCPLARFLSLLFHRSSLPMLTSEGTGLEAWRPRSRSILRKFVRRLANSSPRHAHGAKSCP